MQMPDGPQRTGRQRLDQHLVQLGMLPTRSQAESYIRLGAVRVNTKIITKPGTPVRESDTVTLDAPGRYVSRAGLKLASVAAAVGLDFADKVVLDVGSSTGGFTDYALQHGARKVIAVDVGTDQLHHSLRDNPAIELHEKTDIRDVRLRQQVPGNDSKTQAAGREGRVAIEAPDLVVIDVSFVSLRAILPHVAHLVGRDSVLAVMVKPQFEASASNLKHKGVIKNDHVRRDILKSFETWAGERFIIRAKADSDVPGAKGNRERFYALVRRPAVGALR